MKNGRSTNRHAGRFIAYYRVSTAKQGASGLGLEAQGKAVADHLAATKGTLLAEFTEIESGKRTDRPELDKALSACRLHGAILLVAKLDRLARNAHFLLGLKEAGIEFVCCDMPSANRLTVGIMAMVAEEEARLISVRTKDALAAARERGVKLGSARNATPDGRAKGIAAALLARSHDAKRRAIDRLPFIREAQAAGITSMAGIARALTLRRVPTPWGSTTWHPKQVCRLLKRLNA